MQCISYYLDLPLITLTDTTAIWYQHNVSYKVLWIIDWNDFNKIFSKLESKLLIYLKTMNCSQTPAAIYNLNLQFWWLKAKYNKYVTVNNNLLIHKCKVLQ